VENVSTHSVGTDKNRKIIITYEGPDKAPDNRKSRNAGNPGEKQNQGRGRKRHGDKPARAEGSDGNKAPEGSAAEGSTEGTHTGEGRSRRGRNRRRNSRRDGEAQAEQAKEAVHPGHNGASAIVTAEEKEELDRQLSEIKPKDKPKKPQKLPIEALPDFLQNAVDEPAEHLREN